jgi:hypothetical protein
MCYQELYDPLVEDSVKKMFVAGCIVAEMAVACRPLPAWQLRQPSEHDSKQGQLPLHVDRNAFLRLWK